MWPPQPRPLAIIWLCFSWPGCKMAVVKGYPGPACGIGLPVGDPFACFEEQQQGQLDILPIG